MEEWIEEQLVLFFQLQNKRADDGEISINTITNYYKSIKLFCEMNTILINWRVISKGIKKGNQVSEDRPPAIREIKRLIKYPGVKIKAIVSIMISSGIRSLCKESVFLLFQMCYHVPCTMYILTSKKSVTGTENPKLADLSTMY